MGETEGYTTTPPPLMTNGRTEVKDAITTAQNGQHVLLADPEGGEVTVAEGASPYILTVNAFSHTEGHDNNDNITTSYFHLYAQRRYVWWRHALGETRRRHPEPETANRPIPARRTFGAAS